MQLLVWRFHKWFAFIQMIYPLATVRRLIVKELSVQIPDQKITTIIGPNGCGKVYFTKSNYSYYFPSIWRYCARWKKCNKRKYETTCKKNGYSSHKHLKVRAGLTVGELVSYGRFPYQTGFGRLRRRTMKSSSGRFEVTGTNEFKYYPVDALSGGQRQRVWIAMALAQETEIIFLDEPTTYLDMAHQLEVLELLQKLNQEEKRTIVMVLHDLNQAARFADYIIALKAGEIVKAGTCEEVITQKVLQDVFQIDAEIGLDPRTKNQCVLHTTY